MSWIACRAPATWWTTRTAACTDSGASLTSGRRLPTARSVTLEKAGHSTYHDMEREWITIASAFFAAHASA